jgi:phenylpropionate dioxygenase-like ring-hydroxylating dioxygenase large terminal subunit
MQNVAGENGRHVSQEQLPDLQIDGVGLTDRAPGELLPARAFTSPIFYEAELKYVFERSWVHIADLTELAKPGDFVAGHIGRVPVLVVRDQEGELRGFVNACRHRGATLAEGTGNCGKHLRCPYHAWTYTTDGRLTGVPFREEFDARRLDGMGLLPIRIASAGPLVFGCLDDCAPDFAEWAGEQCSVLREHDPADMELAYEAIYEVPVNWKVYVENGLDGYHVQFVHDVLYGILGSQNASYESHIDSYGSATRVPLDKAFVAALLGVSGTEAAPQIRFGSLLPNLIVITSPGEVTYLRVDPVGPEQIRLRGRAFDHGAESRASRTARQMAFERTNRQDIEVVTRVQRGLTGNRVSPFGHAQNLERRIGHFEQMLLRELRRGISGELITLRRAG